MSDVLLPFNATAQELALEQATARIVDVPLPVRDTANPDTCPAALLPWLAWAYSVDEWDTTWTEAQKRESIKRANIVQRYKGTIGAVREALAALGYDVQLQEWFSQSPPGPEYTYKLILTAEQSGIDDAALAKAISVVEASKNLRSHLQESQVIVQSTAGPSVAAVCNVGSDITIGFQWATVVFNETTIIV